MFATFFAVYGLMPSNSCIAEQVHSGMRDSVKKGVSYESTDCQRSYIVNEEYHAQEEQWKGVRERQKAAGKSGKTKGSTKHEATKLEQQKVGEQLLASGEKYNQDQIYLYQKSN